MICDKVTYETAKEASRQIPHMNKRSSRKHKYRPYKCDNCGKFHLTTTTKLRPWKRFQDHFEPMAPMLGKKGRFKNKKRKWR